MTEPTAPIPPAFLTMPLVSRRIETALDGTLLRVETRQDHFTGLRLTVRYEVAPRVGRRIRPAVPTM